MFLTVNYFCGGSNSFTYCFISKLSQLEIAVKNETKPAIPSVGVDGIFQTVPIGVEVPINVKRFIFTCWTLKIRFFPRSVRNRIENAVGLFV